MAILGWVFIGILALMFLVAVAMGLMSAGDARRYMKIRRM
jgi:hypothetical protein